MISDGGLANDSGMRVSKESRGKNSSKGEKKGIMGMPNYHSN